MLLSSQIAIRRLCRIAASLKAGAAPAAADREWFAACMERYFVDAGQGVSMETAFDLLPAAGGVTWPEAERRDRRDVMLRGLHTCHFAGLPTSEAAREILAAWRRYSRRQLQVDLRRGESTAAARTLDGDLFVLATLGGPPGEDRVADILNGVEQPEAAEVFETV